MVDVRCTKCNYQYTIKKGKGIPKRCTYCDSEGTLRKVKSAQDLLDEVIPIDR